MSDIRNLAILASAGSGKTFQLAHRYIRLLADRNEEILPDRICAMTFTRKAAGEIFDEIAGYLCESASDDKAARITAVERIDLPELKRKDFLDLLRRFIDNLHRTRIGTLDSFIVGIAKAFPLELGIPLDFQVMDNESALAVESRRLALDRILSPSITKSSVQKEFLEAFKRATFGHEEKTFGGLLETFVRDLRRYYRLCPDADKWGGEDLIWPGKGRPWKGRMNADLSREGDIVDKWVEGMLATVANGIVYENIRDIAVVLAGYGPTSSWDGILDKAVFAQLIEHRKDLKNGPVDIDYSRKTYTIPTEPAKALHKLIENLLVVELDRAINRTRGLYDLLKQYDLTYEDITRATGIFSFTDIQYLLAQPESDEAASVITRNPGLENRLYIDYRMDCKLDHWLLDEFQDTSDLQWAIFSELVDEIVQAPEGTERSFFYVGDVKQAIYRWRGGNHRLFQQVLDRFGQAIDYQTMAETRRCAQPIIDVVNKVFQPPFEDLLPEPTANAWGEVWLKHETAQKNEPGYAAILEPPHDTSSDEMTAARYALTADLLKEIRPIERGLSVGILTRTNIGGEAVVDVLRRECPHMSVVHEGNSAIVGNELVQALLAMITMAAHPGDDYAWQYIQMTPFAGLLKDKRIGRGNISRRFMEDIDEHGFQWFVHDWGGRLDVNEYGGECLKRLETAAGEFDASGARDCNGFLEFIDSYSVREQASSGAIRVMTVHQAKGLEFDIVILPELNERGDMASARRTDLVRAGLVDTEWLLRMPKKSLAELDPVLKRQLDFEDEAAGFDSLCLLYVAMTRPKHALYMVTSKGSKTSKSVPSASFIKQQMTGEQNPEAECSVTIGGSEYVKLYESDPDQANWYEPRWPLKPVEMRKEDAVLLPDDYASEHDRRQILKLREPSRDDSDIRSGASLFKDESGDLISFGSAIHELFEKVGWAEDADVDAIVGEWEPTSVYDGPLTKHVIEQFRACMKSDDVREYLSRPGGQVDEPWIEKRFEVILKGELVSGAFDRVIVMRDGAGRAVRATIIDYKSSRVEEKAEIDKKAKEYTPQMETYREALAKILGLEPSAITCCLIFTRQQKIRTV